MSTVGAWAVSVLRGAGVSVRLRSGNKVQLVGKVTPELRKLVQKHYISIADELLRWPNREAAVRNLAKEPPRPDELPPRPPRPRVLVGNPWLRRRRG
jgi:hypothetical protein